VLKASLADPVVVGLRREQHANVLYGLKCTPHTYAKYKLQKGISQEYSFFFFSLVSNRPRHPLENPPPPARAIAKPYII
jgi:hypothetical protein